MTRAEMLALLAKAGITPAATATDIELRSLVEGLVEKSTAPPLTEEMVATVVAKAIAANDAERAKAEPAPRVKATSNAGGLPDAGGEVFSPRNVKDAAEGTGLNFVRMIKASATAKLQGGDAISVLKEWGYNHVASAAERMGLVAKQMQAAIKALGQGTLSAGGALVPTEYSTEFIALLRNTAVVRKSGARSIPLSGSLQMPKGTGAGTASYVAEAASIAASTQELGMITFTERKLAALTVFSNELLRNASLSAEQFVLEDLRNVMALREDLAFLFGTGASDTPRGIESLIATANLVTPAAVDPLIPTLREVRVALADIVKLLMSGNIPMTTMGWLFTPRTWGFLWSVVDGNGNAVFQAEMSTGKLMGFPFIVTNQIANTYDTTADASRLILGDWAQAIIAEAQMVQAEVFPNGTYESGGVAVSGISRDQSVVRLLASHDFNVRYNTAFVSAKVRWGA